MVTFKRCLILPAILSWCVPAAAVVQRTGSVFGQAGSHFGSKLTSKVDFAKAASLEASHESAAAALVASERSRVAKAADSAADMVAKRGVASIVFGVALVLLGSVVHWFNEERSARFDVLIAKGRAEVVAGDADYPSSVDRGRLVHVHGIARAAAVVTDPQFPDLAVSHILKLQSTVEVFQWNQTMRTFYDGTDGTTRRSQPRFHSEWTTVHRKSRQFRKPSPENPDPPAGIMLGTRTALCPRVKLGSFVLPEAMVNAFQHFEPAMQHLPDRIQAGTLTFVANHQDGYFYARPAAFRDPPGDLFSKHEVGDMRIHFLCVPESEATVVAAQCHKEGDETFVPYRPVALGPCVEDWKAKQYVVEEGYRSFRDLQRDTSCCAGGYGIPRCFCCACNAIGCICSQEAVTEEIFYVSDRLDPVDVPFQNMVPRSSRRVWGFRAVGFATFFFGVKLALQPFASAIEGAQWLAVYGSSATAVLALAVTAAASALFVAAAAACYRPLVTVRWILVAAFLASAPVVVGGLLHHKAT